MSALLPNEAVPEGWRRLALKDVLTAVEYGTSAPVDDLGQRPVVGMRELQQGRVLTTGLRRIQDHRDLNRLELRAGDLLLNRTNSPDLVGKVGIVEADSDAVFASYLIRLRVNHEVIVPAYLNCWLNSSIAQSFIRRLVTRGVSQANINPTALQAQCPVLVPPLQEQRAIVEILQDWDRAIGASDRLIHAKHQRLSAVRAELVSEPSWPREPLSNLTDRVREINDGEVHPVMTISASAGFVLQSEKYNRDMAGTSLASYTKLRRGDFAYNRGNSLRYPQGCIYPLKVAAALVPSIYFSFRLQDALNPDFYEHFFMAGGLNPQLKRIISSSVRGNGLLNIRADDFFSCLIPVPPLESQNRIAAALNDLAEEIALLKLRDEALRKQRGGLSRALLSGEARVREA